MGLGSEEGLSLSALNILKKADVVYLETYTGLVTENNIINLERLIGKNVISADRTKMENGDKILETAKNEKLTAVVVVGDPMSATTHVDLRLRAYDAGLDCRVIPGSSIFTAAPGLCGLQNYKLGRTTTLAFPQGDYFPDSPYEIIGQNLKLGLHTLVLLELTTDENRIMTAPDGIKILLELESKAKKGFFTEQSLVCVIARAGTDSAVAKAGRASEMIKTDFGEPMHCLIIPGKLHFKEAEALVKLCGAPKDILDGVD